MAEQVQPTNPTNPIPAVQSAPSTPSEASTPSPSTPDLMSYIPESYRSNPASYFERIKEDAEWAKYGRGVAPHHKTFEQVQAQWNEFEQWRRGQQGQARPGTPAPQAPEADDEDLDYGDPEAVKRAIRQLKQQVQGHVQQFGSELSRLSSEQEQGQRTLFEFLKIQQELRDLTNQELYQHTKFQPTTNPQDLARFMLEQNISDPHKAHELLYGKPSLEAKVKTLEADAQKMYEQGKADAEQALASRRVTTETSVGTPWRLRTGEGKSQYAPNSPERKQEIMDRMTEKLGLPREQAVW